MQHACIQYGYLRPQIALSYYTVDIGNLQGPEEKIYLHEHRRYYVVSGRKTLPVCKHHRILIEKRVECATAWPSACGGDSSFRV